MTTIVKSPELGIFHDLNFEKYLQAQGLNQSTAKRLLKAEKKIPSSNFPNFIFGTAGHCLVLEPDRFYECYVRAPDGLKQRGKAGKEKWAEFQAKQGGKIVLRANQWDALKHINNAVKVHPGLKTLFASGQPEISLFWKNLSSDILCKGRLDWVDTSSETILDLKFSNISNLDAAIRQTRHNDYDFQAAWYTAGLKELTGNDFRFILIFIQKFSPHQVVIHELSKEDLDSGREKVLRVFEKIGESSADPILPLGGGIKARTPALET